MNIHRWTFQILAVISFFGICDEAKCENSEFDSAKAYTQIARDESDAEVRDAVSKLSAHYKKNRADGEILLEPDRDIILKAIPVIIEHMDDADKELANEVFCVLASLQFDCPAPKKEYWQEWWNRKQSGERITWAVQFTARAKNKAGIEQAAAPNP